MLRTRTVARATRPARYLRWLAGSALVLIAACGGSDDPVPIGSQTVTVTVTGLRHSYNGATLRNNGGDDLQRLSATAHSPSRPRWPSGGAYAVTVFAQPTGPDSDLHRRATAAARSPAPTSPTSPSSCPFATAYAVGGSVSGLTGTGLGLQYSADNVSLPSALTR